MAQTTTQLKQQRAIALLLGGHTIGKVAAEIGVSEKAVDNWLREEDFKNELMSGARRVVDVTCSRLIGLNNKCFAVLLDILQNGTDRNRLMAVRLIFEHTTKWLENDAVQRLERLESILLEQE